MRYPLPRWSVFSGCAAYVPLLLSLSACGRVGVELLPHDDGLSVIDRDGGTVDGDTPSDDAEGIDEAGSLDRDAELFDADSQDGDASTTPDDDAGSAPSCPTPCENAHGSASCETGTCVASCATGYADCDGNPTNGCEADIAGDTLSCGRCAEECTNGNGQSLCSGGLCAPVCASNFGDCDDEPNNGCETSLRTVAACGACGVTCTNAHGTTSCSAAGVCTPVCAAGYSDCDGNPRNGCEANIATDPARCGSCGRACGTNGQICVSGMCQASPCATGRAECDGDLTVTCETNTTNTVSDCGFCDNVCTTANGTPQCNASACAIASCNSGFANCDNNVGTGCETRLATTTAHCGSCGNACTNAHGTTSCAASACVPSCSTGFGDCDTTRQNGCETALNSISNCGSCGRTCPANGGTAVCNAGVCGTICDLTGTFALKVTHQTSWPSNSNIRSGSGTHVYWLKLQGTHSGNSVSETITECGRTVPDFSASAVSETFKFQVPNSVFDGNFLPSSSASVTLGSSSPGATFVMPSTAFMIGASMSDPVNAAWPSAASGLTRVDMDGDGKAGVTVNYLNGGGYTYPRTGGTLFSSRAQQPYSATRLVFSLNGTLSSCTQSSGSATVSHIDTRIFGCRISGGSQDCNSSESNFLDQNCLRYAVGTASYSLVKVANGASCAAVRAALP